VGKNTECDKRTGGSSIVGETILKDDGMTRLREF